MSITPKQFAVVLVFAKCGISMKKRLTHFFIRYGD